MRACIFDDAADGALGDTVERVYMRRACRMRDELGVQEIFELVREELTGVVAAE